MRKLISAFFRLAVASTSGRAVIVPPGIVPDNQGMWGLWGAAQNLNQAVAIDYATLASASQTVTASAADLIAGVYERTGAPGGAVTETTPTAAQIIAALPNTIPQDGTFQFPIRYINNALGQTVTLTPGANVTVTGTATIATNTWRDFLVTVRVNAGTVEFTNIGAGTL